MDYTLAKLATSLGSLDLEKTVEHEIQSHRLDPMHEIGLNGQQTRACRTIRKRKS